MDLWCLRSVTMEWTIEVCLGHYNGPVVSQKCYHGVDNRFVWCITMDLWCLRSVTMEWKIGLSGALQWTCGVSEVLPWSGQ